MRRGPVRDEALVELERAVAMLAAELGVAVAKRFLHVLYFPKRLVAPGRAYATAFYFTFVELFGVGNELRGHGTHFFGGEFAQVVRGVLS